ncbi:ATP-binding protein [Hoeflea sp. CAU 1731]
MTMQDETSHSEDDKARDLLRDAVESLAEAFALCDEDNRLVLFNRRFVEMFRPIEPLLEPGLNWEILLREAARRGMRLHGVGRDEAWTATLFSDTLEYVQDLELEHLDGSSYLVSIHPTKLGGFAVTGTDNTIRKQAEAAERDSELLIRTVLESSPANVIMSRLGDGMIIYRSEAARELFGDKKSTRDFFLSPEDRADYITVMMPEGGVDDYRINLLNARGQPFPASISGRMAEYKGEEVVVATTIDLTSQVEAEALIRQVLEACPVPIQMTIADSGQILFASPETTALFGPVESSRSYYVDELARVRYLDELKRRGWVKNYRAEFRNARGDTFWGAVSSRMIGFQGQEVIVSNTRDLSDDLAMQDELERQRELLFQNEKMSALGELLAGVAHELNNPLTVIVGHSMMMLEDIEDPEARKRVEKINAAAERCARIVKTFLAMARQQPARMEKTDINAIIRTAVDVAGYGHAADGIEINCILDDSLPEIVADADQITQVLINLVINAEHAITRSGTGSRIEVTTRTGAHGSVEIYVDDDGPGIAEAIRPRIFEPFFTTKDVGEGTGIGLAFCHRIILSHGGQIWLDRGGQGGSRFGIRLPVRDQPEPAAEAPHPIEAKNTVRILVVDDEEDVAELISLILKREGFQPDTAESGPDAVACLRRARYDIILSDLNMPGMDGRGLYEAVSEEFPEMLDRLGFITGDTMGQASQRLLEETGRPYLEKPVAPADLRELVGKLLGNDSEGKL